MDATLWKSLHDRLYDKRKAAALDLERVLREAVQLSDQSKIDAIIKQLVASFQQPVSPLTTRGGSLIGLAASAIALGDSIHSFLPEMLPPILACTRDVDTRTRFFAMESLYNLTKVSRGHILLYFPAVWDTLTKVCQAHYPENTCSVLNNSISSSLTQNSA